jgi:serine/threonine protein kinase
MSIHDGRGVGVGQANHNVEANHLSGGGKMSLRRSFSDISLTLSPLNGGETRLASSFPSSGKLSSKDAWKPEGLFSSTSGRRSHGSRSKKKEWIIDLENIDLMKTMGSGGAGEVWQGLWQGLDVAVKILYRQGGHVFGSDNAKALPKHLAKVEKAFQAEVYSLSNLRHPNIVLFMGACRSEVQVMNVQNAELQYGIVTEYMSGGSIHDHIHRGDWVQTASPKLLRSIAKDITLGMLYLHNEGIIHRDLKSRNILTDNNWHTKIADFDLSRIRETTIYKNDPSSSLIGTPSWMAPELIQGLKYDEKVDVYSFGVVLFELFSGEIPFASLYGQELNHVRIVYDVVKHGARPIIPEYVPNAMKVLISKCWAQDAKDRPSFSTILAILNEENATEKYCCHVHNAHLLEEDEILSISARSLNAAGTHRSSPFSTTSTTVGSSDNMSSLGSLSKSSNSLPADKSSELNRQGSAKKKAKKLPIKISKWIKRIFKHI